jgi:AmmeMemoRadiSam system protein B
MSLVFAAISPHPPVLIPSIGKESINKIAKTRESLQKLEEDLYLSHPDVILIISPHGSLFSEAFTMNFCPEYETDLREFGDLATKLKFKGETHLTARIRQACKEADIQTTMVSEKNLDHGSAVPLFYLTKHLPQTTIIPVGFCDADWKTHTEFGYVIKEQIMNLNKRVAVIASGDLSHALTTDAPASYNPAGQEFDNKIQELLASGNASGLLRLDPQLVTDAAECGFRSFLILLGILRGVNYNYKSYSYEAPFGVGYLTANFVI